jgi:hypothetical protein
MDEHSTNLPDVSQYILGLKEIEHLFPDVVPPVEIKQKEILDPEKKKIYDLLNKFKD